MDSTTIAVATVLLVVVLGAVYYYTRKPTEVPPGTAVPLAGVDATLPNGAVVNANGTTTLPSGATVPTTPTLLKVSGCEAAPAVLSCPAGTVIKSGDIRYGRWDTTSCPHPTVNANTRMYDKHYALPSKYVGAQTSTVSGGMHIVVGEDPLPNVYKQYEINYSCQ